jgi:hypothetical protein
MHLLGSSLEKSAASRDEQGISREQRRRFGVVWVFYQVEDMSSGVAGCEQHFDIQTTNLERVARRDLVCHFRDSVIA